MTPNRTNPRDRMAPDLHDELRRFVDPHGEFWLVEERDTRSDPGSRGPHCLVFSSDAIIRRVWTYPAGWAGLSDADLVALSWSR